MSGERVEDVFETGKKYKVRFDDCCVKGVFTATVTSVAPMCTGIPSLAEDSDSDMVRFDNGVTLEETFWDKLEVEEV